MSETLIKQLRRDYFALAHAMQSGVRADIETYREGFDDSPAASPKHLRTGINSAMVEHSALAWLLIRNGVITELEYYEALVEFMGAEVQKYEELLSKRLKRKVTLA